MNSNRRARGRPIGTGLNDGPALEKIADLLVEFSDLKATTAIRRTLAKPGPSEIRRLQVKWKAGSAEYLANARARRAAAQTLVPARHAGAPCSPHTARKVMESHRRMHDAVGPTIRAAQGMVNSPAMLAAQEAAHRFHESPAMRAIEEYQNSPTIRAIREFQNSPTMLAMREFHGSPTMRAMRDLHQSPTMRAAREAAEEVAKFQRLIIGPRS